MYGALLVLHILVCLALIGVVLLQSGKGGGLAGGAFGGTAQTVFGGRGATDFLSRATMVLGGLFFVTSLVLALMSTNARSSRSLLQDEARRSAPATAPTTPGGALPSGAGPAAQPATPQPASPAGAPSTAPAPATAPGGK